MTHDGQMARFERLRMARSPALGPPAGFSDNA